MKNIFKACLAVFCIFQSPILFSQSYTIQQGYIFEQKYLKQVSVKMAEEIANSPDVFQSYLTGQWGEEKIATSQVIRKNDLLSIKFKNRPSLTLQDYILESSEGVEGDSQLFKYIKSVPNYIIIGVLYGHDQPGFLLIAENGSEFYYVDTYK
ncbi:hypothetical protein [Parathalassolituus penaei]|uniref:Uncharacterized protein n=1 Tax=Parathalassolituus penaei TaxID=2997323 RepID=A0A9X3EAU6_9GAMM|nr:hypothetical protein [Parathalassolituus penaei]MCY0963776.1 hypothetical protein [Parathalassolituus penaei]